MNEEARLALVITRFLHTALPADAVAFHVPNEGRRTVHEQSRFFAAGGKAGIPDRWILWRGSAYCWEEKAMKGRLNEAQQAMFPKLEAAGFPVPIIRSLGDAEACLLRWGIPLRASLALPAPARPRPRSRSDVGICTS